MAVKKCLLLFFVFVEVLLVYSQETCSSHLTCGKCIQQPECYWCSVVDLTGKTHCHNTLEDADACPAASKVSPKSTVVKITDEEIQLKPDKPLVQIRPQHVKVRLRRGEEVEVDFQYGQAPNFPIDLYYLMDLSASMKVYKDSLAELGDKLIDTMRDITSNFRIGFGSFVDKTEMPFVSTLPEKIKNPCQERAPCAPAYSYINHQSLSDGADFSNQVNLAKVSGNLDSPEGGFDALMQAMVCKREIGWRDNARHIIVFSTDAPFHIAGDGKLAGVVEPNDAKCHLFNNEYNESLTYDYPSISHVNYVAKQLGFNIFFAIVGESTYRLYKLLSDEIENSGVARLQASASVIKQITDFYSKISTDVQMRVHNADGNVDVRFSCRYANGTQCGAVSVNDVVDFKARIKVSDCSGNRTQRLLIRPGTLNISLTVDVETICDCDCEKGSVEADPQCNQSGGLQCGVCSCQKGFYGKTCECNGQNDYTSDLSKCIRANDTRVCSGIGECICGACHCNKQDDPSKNVYGQFCECDNYTCQKHMFKLCGGNGRCDCGKCRCNEGWSGDACDCRSDDAVCTVNGKVCNDKGSCKCGRCECDIGYYGSYCEECAKCSGGRCDELKPCVECSVHGTGEYKDECDVKCAQYRIQVVEEVDDVDSENIKVCRYKRDDGCFMIFKYYYDDNQLVQIKARKEFQCAAPIIYALVFGLIGSILLVGILTLIIWKLVTVIHDRREYAKFENERNNAKWNRNDNPLFKAPVSNFRNPTYAK